MMLESFAGSEAGLHLDRIKAAVQVKEYETSFHNDMHQS